MTKDKESTCFSELFADVFAIQKPGKRREGMRARMDFGLMRRKTAKGTVWYYWIYDENNVRIYRSTGERTKARAMDYVLALRGKGELGKRDRSMVLFGDFTENFFIPGECPIERHAHMRGKSMTKATLLVRRTALVNHILPHFKKRAVSQISQAMVNSWLLALPETDKVSRTTANATLIAFRMVMEEAVRQGVISVNPCVGVEPLGNDSTRRASYTVAEVQKVIGRPEEWENPMIRTMCLTSALTGMRLGEVRALKADCITETSLHIRASYSEQDGYKTPKNGEERVTPIPAVLRDELRSYDRGDGGYLFRQYKQDEPITDSWVTVCLRKRLEDLGIKGKSFHSFRAFYNTEMVAAGVEGDLLRKVIGHQSPDMTEHYLHLETGEFSHLREAQLGLVNKITS